MVNDAGFTAPEITVTVVGKLTTHDGELVLATPDDGPSFVLRGGEVVSEIHQRDDLAGQPIRVIGKLHADHGDDTAGLTLERWEIVPPKAETEAETEPETRPPPVDNDPDTTGASTP